MFKKIFIKYIIVSLLVVFTACRSEFRRIQRSDDWKAKYEAAIRYYEKKDYYRSVLLFDDIKPFIKGTKEAEMVDFYYAYAHFYQKQYLVASHYFKKFHDTYNRSEHAQEALYMNGYALYKQSPSYNLDQTSTVEAIESLQKFLNRYPTSEYREKAIEVMAQSMEKLEKKEFENAKLYFTLNNMFSARIALDNFIKDYPDSKLVEDALYYLILSTYEYAKASIPSKQRERYYDCIDRYESFIDNYPESKYLKEVQDYYSTSIDEIEKLKENEL